MSSILATGTAISALKRSAAELRACSRRTIMSGTASGVAAPSISSAISCARRGQGHRRLRHLAGNGRDLRYRPLLYHSRHPLLALECAASVCAGTLVAETVLDATDVARPAMVFYPGAVLKNDPSSWWGPNLPCVEAMLHEVDSSIFASRQRQSRRNGRSSTGSSKTRRSLHVGCFTRAASASRSGFPTIPDYQRSDIAALRWTWARRLHRVTPLGAILKPGAPSARESS